MDQVQNFIKGTVAGTHNAIVTTINVADADDFPNPADGEYNLTWYDSTNYPDPADDPNVEIVRVTARDTGADTLTVIRDQEGSGASTKSTAGATYKLILTPTKKSFGEKLDLQKGYMANGKIDVSVVSDDLVVAIKTLAGNDPSSDDPVYARIGNTYRPITSALSVTLADGTNWFDSGSTDLATKLLSYYAYLGYNSTDGVVLGISRVQDANEYDDFSTTSTDDDYAAISTITNAAAGDDYEQIGRFVATLSAGAGYTWTVPTFSNKNLIQRPVLEKRSGILGSDVLSAGFSTTSGSYVDTGLEITVTTKRTSNLKISMYGRSQNSTDATFFQLKIIRDTTDVREVVVLPVTNGVNNLTEITGVDEKLEAGTYVYKVQMATQGGDTCVLLDASKLIVELTDEL